MNELDLGLNWLHRPRAAGRHRISAHDFSEPLTRKLDSDVIGDVRSWASACPTNGGTDNGTTWAPVTRLGSGSDAVRPFRSTDEVFRQRSRR